MQSIDSNSKKETGFVFAFAAVLWCLFASRWGSHLIKFPVYINDLLFILFCVGYLLDYAFKNSSINNEKKRSKGNIFLRLFVLWVCIRSIFSNSKNLIDFSVDFAPYLYLLIGLLIPFYYEAMITFRFRIYKWILYALYAHAVWFSAFVLIPSLSTYFPFVNLEKNIRVFTVRPDFDSAIATLLIGLILYKRKAGKLTPLNFILVPVITISILASGTRSGLLALVVVTVLSLILRRRMNLRITKTWLSTVTSIFGFAMLLIFSTQRFLMGERLGISQNDFNSFTEANAQALGTYRARLQSWLEILKYIFSSTSRTMFGDGFGFDYMRESNALLYLVGSSGKAVLDPRSPHNYILNTFARLGLIGLILLVLLLLSTLRKIIELYRVGIDEIQATAILGFFAILTTALFGVVLESPFGAIPFAFFIGVLHSKYSTLYQTSLR